MNSNLSQEEARLAAVVAIRLGAQASVAYAKRMLGYLGHRRSFTDVEMAGVAGDGVFSANRLIEKIDECEMLRNEIEAARIKEAVRRTAIGRWLFEIRDDTRVPIDVYNAAWIALDGEIQPPQS